VGPTNVALDPVVGHRQVRCAQIEWGTIIYDAGALAPVALDDGASHGFDPRCAVAICAVAIGFSSSY
ncbi:MAG: hypothetical protein LH616_13000, partial [Ilumatobacteraceae bacterium]|nr:hypothetical protein [Ilumatobacteraceae bacterium]